MIYIYDIMLNFNDKLYEFFEWNDEDNIFYIRKIPLFRVSDNVLSDIINNKVIISKNFTQEIKNTYNFYDKDIKDNYDLLCLFTNTKIVVGVAIKNNEIVHISRLLLDEEKEIINVSENLDETFINYKLKNKRNNNSFVLTRYESMVREELLLEIDKLYKESNFEKLKYYYFEYFLEIDTNIDKMCKKLYESVLNNFNNKHIKLYEIIMLSN